MTAMRDGRSADTPFRIPRRLRAAADRPDGPEFTAWVAALPKTIAMVAARWHLQVSDPFEPGGQCSWVAPARTHAAGELVLKLGWHHDEAIHEADALVLWDGAGAVQLQAADTVDRTLALLLERCMPGTTLALLDEPEQDVVIAALLRRLWVRPPPGHRFRPLGVMCHRWADEFERRLPRAVPPIDLGIARLAATLLRELPDTAAESVLLCTDLHAENVLAARREPWLVIDPKPYLGDPHYDPVQHLLNCQGRLATDPAGLAHRLADLLDLEPGRLRLWLFARCVQESLDQPGLRHVAAQLAP